jgi:hypothetical protein
MPSENEQLIPAKRKLDDVADQVRLHELVLGVTLSDAADA